MAKTERKDVQMGETAIVKVDEGELNKLRTLEQNRSVMAEQMDAMKAITSEAAFDAAVELGKAAGTLVDSIVAWFKPMKQAAHQAHQEICKREKEAIEPLEGARSRLRERCRVYFNKRKAREEELQAKRDEEAKKTGAVAAPVQKLASGKGYTVVTKYRANVIDKMALIKAVAAGKASADLLSPNSRELDRIAAALGPANMAPPAGVAWESYEETRMNRS